MRVLNHKKYLIRNFVLEFKPQEVLNPQFCTRVLNHEKYLIRNFVFEF